MSGDSPFVIDFLTDDDLLDALLRWHFVHHVEHRFFKNGAQTTSAAFPLDGSRAIARSPAFVKRSFTPSISKSLSNCLTRLFFGVVRMSMNASSLSSSRVAMTGKRPMNSGMRPNLADLRAEPAQATRQLDSRLFFTSAPKPSGIDRFVAR